MGVFGHLYGVETRQGSPVHGSSVDICATADPFDPNYNTPDKHRDLKKLTFPTSIFKRKK